MPPQGAAARLHQQIAFAGRRGFHRDTRGIAGLIGGFVDLQFDLIRTQRAGAVGVVLPPVTCLETHAADDVVTGMHFKTIGAPLYRETDFLAAARRNADALLLFLQIFFIVT